jgi:hypothetical protein
MIDYATTHPNHSQEQRLDIDKSRARAYIACVVEARRIAIVGTPGQQADRDRKAAVALNALNDAPEAAAYRSAAQALLAAPALAMGVTPTELAVMIKGKRDRETAALMALDAYRVAAARAVESATSHGAVESAVTMMQRADETVRAMVEEAVANG